MSTKMIAVVGSTSGQGGSVAQMFLSDPKLKGAWTVRGLTRNPSKSAAQKLVAQGAEVVQADVNDPASLEKAFAGADTVFAVTDYWATLDMKVEIQQGKNLVDSAKKAAVKHFILSTLKNVTELSGGKLPNVYHFDSKAAISKYAKEAGLPTTYFMPGFYMSNMTGPLAMLRQLPPNNVWTLTFPIPSSATLTTYDHDADTGKFVKGIVLKKDAWLGREVYAATAYQTADELLAEFRATFPGTEVVYHQPTHEEYLAMLKGAGMPDHAALELLENFRLFDEFGYYGKAALSLDVLEPEDKPTTWVEHLKRAPTTKDLK